jgi:hypothetical protein
VKEKAIVERVDVVIGSKDAGDERIVTVAKSVADRWPDVYRPATTGGDEPAAADDDDKKPAVKRSRPTAAAKRAKDLRNAKPEPIKSPDDLPSAPDPAAASAAAAIPAGTSGATSEGAAS